MIQTVPLFLKHVAPSTKQDCCGLGEVLLGGRTYQMESDVSCLIGTSAPALGCSRPPWVGWVVLRGWHGAWGNLKEKKKSQLEVGSPRPEYLPVLPVFLRSNQLLVVRRDGRTCFRGNQKKPSLKWSSSLLPL